MVTVPLVPGWVITTLFLSRSPSRSVSFAVISISTGVLWRVSALSSFATGGSVISMVTVALLDTLPFLSLTRYVMVSWPVASGFAVYTSLPSTTFTVPLVGSLTTSNVVGSISPSRSVSLPKTSNSTGVALLAFAESSFATGGASMLMVIVASSEMLPFLSVTV